MNHFIYKCNSTQSGLGQEYGHWRDVFSSYPWRTRRWGTIATLRGLDEIRKGDEILCLQSNPESTLVGVARAMGSDDGQLLLKPVEKIGVKIRPLKQADPWIAAIWALQSGPIRTAYPITAAEAARLLQAARGKPVPAKWERANETAVRTAKARLKDLPKTERRIALREINQVIRNALLRRSVLRHWPAACAACGCSIESGDRAECEVAHVRDVHSKGADQIRNALPLCRTHHWAFDALLWAIRPKDHRMVVRASLRKNRALKVIHGRVLRPPKVPGLEFLAADVVAWRWNRFKDAAAGDL